MKPINPFLAVHRWAKGCLQRQEVLAMQAAFASFGKGSELVYPFDIRGAAFIRVDARVFIGPRVLMGAAAGAEITLEELVMLGPDVKLIPGDHRFDLADTPIRDSGPGKQGAIVIQRGAWIGAGSIILKGVTVGEGAIVGAGSVVTRSIPAREIWAGNPAAFVRPRLACT